MNFLPENTLAHYEALASKRVFDLSKRPLAAFAAATKEYRKNCGEVSPDVRALEFYACNHYYSKLAGMFSRNEPMPAWATTIASAYSKVLTEQSERLMHYLFCIITREIRHLKSPELSKMKAKVKELGGEAMVEFMPQVLKNNEGGAVSLYMDSPPDVGAGPYVRTLEYLFDNGWPAATSFGGKAWGQIARCLGDMLCGKTSLEMMVDTSYTLAHNNGPMFNKGMMYSMYLPQFTKILDVQRSGQIPELVKTKSSYSWLASLKIPGLQEITELAYLHMPNEFGQFVDWHKVKALGALTSVEHEIKQQAKTNPTPPAAPAAPKTVMFGGKPAIEVGVFQVFPGQTIPVFQRKVA